MEVASAARGEDFVARGCGEGGRVDWCALDVQGGEEGVGCGCGGRDVVQEKGRGWSGGEQERVVRVEGQGVDGRGLGFADVLQSMDVDDFLAQLALCVGARVVFYARQVGGVLEELRERLHGEVLVLVVRVDFLLAARV